MNLIISILLNYLFLLNYSSAKSNDGDAPVVIWSKALQFPNYPGLSSLSSTHFSRLVHKLTSSSPNIVLFVEKKLTLEDLSARDTDGQPVYKNLNLIAQTNDLEFLPSVVNPLKVIRNLEDNEGYVFTHYKDHESVTTEPKLILVSLHSKTSQEHDFLIAKIYKELSDKYDNLLAIYSGKNSAQRSKRETTKADETPPNIVIVTEDQKTAILASTIEFTRNDVKTQLTNPSNVQWVNQSVDSATHVLQIKFTEATLQLNFLGEDNSLTSWSLVSILVNNTEPVLYPTDIKVWAPARQSYFCQKETEFNTIPLEKKIVFTGLQMQPFMENFEFGQAVDCVPYFSTAIWSGIFIVFILLIIMGWGVTMIMDINTMDRFDDPKGKTITISAVE